MLLGYQRNQKDMTLWKNVEKLKKINVQLQIQENVNIMRDQLLNLAMRLLLNNVDIKQIDVLLMELNVADKTFLMYKIRFGQIFSKWLNYPQIQLLCQ